MFTRPMVMSYSRIGSRLMKPSKPRRALLGEAAGAGETGATGRPANPSPDAHQFTLPVWGVLTAAFGVAGLGANLLHSDNIQTRQELDSLRTDVKQEVSALRTELKTEMREGFDRIDRQLSQLFVLRNLSPQPVANLTPPDNSTVEAPKTSSSLAA